MHTHAHTHTICYHGNTYPWCMNIRAHTHTGGRWGSGLNVYAAFWSASHSCNHVSVMQRHSQTWACVNCQLDAFTPCSYQYTVSFHDKNNQHCMYHIKWFHIFNTKLMPSSNTYFLHPYSWVTCGADSCRSIVAQTADVCVMHWSLNPFGSCII